MPFFWFRNRMGSASKAKERLLAAIAYDRSWISGEAEEALKKEILEAIRRRLPEPLQGAVRLEVREEGGEVLLALRIPKA